LQHVVTGKAISFSSLPALSELILEMAQSKDNLRRSNDLTKERNHEVSDENLRETGSKITKQLTSPGTGRGIAHPSRPVSRFFQAVFILALCLVATNVSAAPGSPLKGASGASPSSAILCVDDVNAYAPGAPCTNAQTYTSINAALQAASSGARSGWRPALSQATRSAREFL